MRVVWGIVIAACFWLPAAGGAAGRQDPPASQPTPVVERDPSAAPKAGLPQTKPTKSEPESEAKTEAKPQPNTGPKKKADAGAVPANARRRAARRHASAPEPDGTPRKVVVREGGTDEPTAQIVTGMAPEESNRQRQDAEQLLSSTEAAVQRLGAGTLDAPQQETVSQIHNYMAGARSALKEGDISRAHTLAVKASLLAGDLAKH